MGFWIGGEGMDGRVWVGLDRHDILRDSLIIVMYLVIPVAMATSGSLQTASDAASCGQRTDIIHGKATVEWTSLFKGPTPCKQRA